MPVSISLIVAVKNLGTSSVAVENGRQISTKNPNIELIVVSGLNPSRQRNLAVQHARGEIIYFLDDDSSFTIENIQWIRKLFNDHPDIAVVGGPAIIVNKEQHTRPATMVLGSFYGVGFITKRYQQRGPSRLTNANGLILCNLAVRRQIFLDTGGLDPAYYPCDENEWLQRLQNQGHKILYTPQLVIERSFPDQMPLFLSKIFTYGRARGEYIQESLNLSSLIFLAPMMLLFIHLLFLLHHILGFQTLLAHTIFLIEYLYVTFLLMGSLQLCWSRHCKTPGRPWTSLVKDLLGFFIILIALHSSYAMGSLIGVVLGKSYDQSTPALLKLYRFPKES